MKVTELLNALRLVEEEGGGDRELWFVGEYSQPLRLTDQGNRVMGIVEADLAHPDFAFLYFEFDPQREGE